MPSVAQRPSAKARLDGRPRFSERRKARCKSFAHCGAMFEPTAADSIGERAYCHTARSAEASVAAVSGALTSRQ